MKETKEDWINEAEKEETEVPEEESQQKFWVWNIATYSC
jgi:hypothetical protein